MRICIYGLPCAGKTTLMNKLKGWKILSGGTLLHDLAREKFSREWAELSLTEKDMLRRDAAEYLATEDNYVVDGHYSFGILPVLPDEETLTYDVSFYLYTDPEVIRERMLVSDKNRKYASFNIASWQLTEIEKIREKCHRLNRDFYVISDGGESFPEFLEEVINGFSCINKGFEIAESLLKNCTEKNITVSDGDKTLATEDTERKFSGFRTTVFDGDFYTGYQTWLHAKENWEFSYDCSEVAIRSNILKSLKHTHGGVITAGPLKIWEDMGKRYDISVFGGNDISAETKYFAVKKLREAGKMVTAYGDSMSDYYMLHEADMGILVSNGKLSRSLKDRDLHGLYVYEGD